MAFPHYLTTTLLCLLSFSLAQTVADMGLIAAEADDNKLIQFFCVRCYQKLYNFSSSRQQSSKYPLSQLEFFNTSNTCDPPAVPSHLSNTFPILNATCNADKRREKNDSCTVAASALLLQSLGAPGVIFSVPFVEGANEEKGNIPVAAMIYGEKSVKSLLNFSQKHPNGTFSIYVPEERSAFDGSLLVIALMAVFAVASGSLWSGYVKHKLRERLSAGHDASPQSVSEADERRDSNTNQPVEEVALKIPTIYVFFFVIILSGMLICLYFFFDYLVYVIIGMFCIASVIAMYSCFEPFIFWTYQRVPWCGTKQLPTCNLYLIKLSMELRQLLLLILSIATVAIWATFRNDDTWVWALQDFLGILFCINMLKTIRLASLKICTALLSVLFIYDIFFVFITPLFTKGGDSVMVVVATGGSSGEMLPIALKVPHMNNMEGMEVCGIGISMLGFGDILVPGLVVSYCHSYDLLARTPFKLYWSISLAMYVVGLAACFVSLFLMQTAQPALLFVVPIILLPIFLVAVVRGDFTALWKGDFEEPTDYQQDHPVSSSSSSSSNSQKTTDVHPSSNSALA